jgi:hypothetical protein
LSWFPTSFATGSTEISAAAFFLPLKQLYAARLGRSDLLAD